MFTQQLINGLALGAVYALIALGYTMVYGILQLINFAHGEVYMLGAYLGIIIFGMLTALGLPAFSLSLSLLITVLISIAFCSLYGAAIERVAYRPLRNATKLAPLISAVGMSIILQNFIMLSQGKEYKNLPPQLPSEGVIIFDANVSPAQIFILSSSILIMIVLHLFVSRTRLGKAMRATSQDRMMAGLVGININQVISVTFMIGSGLAAVAGVMVTLYYGVVHFFMGYLAGIKAFTAAVLGGIGSIPGAMLGGFMLGLIENFGASYISSVYKDAFAFVVLIVTLLIRPSGLLGRKELDKV
ncbi:MAG: ABC transporter permease [Nitrospirae bacterium GWD2_57_9]|nr:MAG: ABC transporter permease [Nitrospirae bacterium GWD2_57_9]OGW47547.1 MAG: ABC transporter permease [Nitrospirae bacterium GWC2_57_9]